MKWNNVLYSEQKLYYKHTKEKKEDISIYNFDILLLILNFVPIEKRNIL